MYSDQGSCRPCLSVSPPVRRSFHLSDWPEAMVDRQVSVSLSQPLSHSNPPAQQGNLLPTCGCPLSSASLASSRSGLRERSSQRLTSLPGSPQSDPLCFVARCCHRLY